MSQFSNHETNVEETRLAELQQKSSESVQMRIRNRLMGVGTASARQEEQQVLGSKGIEGFDFSSLPEFANLVDLVSEPAILEEQIKLVVTFKAENPTYAPLVEQMTEEILSGEISSVAEAYESGRLFNFPRELLETFSRAVAALVLVAIVAGTFPFESASAESNLSTVTPTAQATPEVTPTLKPTMTPTPTETVAVEPTPETKIVIVETREVNTTSNIRSGPGTNFPIVGSLTAGETVTVTQNMGDWLRISYVDSKTNKEVGSGDDQRYIFESLTGKPVLTRVEIPIPVAENTTGITETVPITAGETITTTTPVQSEGIGGPTTDEELLNQAKEHFSQEGLLIVTFGYDLPIAVDQEANLVGYFKDRAWQDLQPDIFQSENVLEAIQEVLPNAAELSTEGESSVILDKNGNMLLRIEGKNLVVLQIEKLLIFLKEGTTALADFNLDSQEIIAIKLEDGIQSVVIGKYKFQFLGGQWRLVPNVPQATPTPEEPVISQEIEASEIEVPIVVNMNEGYDFDGILTLTDETNNIVYQWLLEAFSKSPKLSSIMGTTTEEVQAYLEAHDYILPKEFKLPFRAPNLVDYISIHDRVIYKPSESPIALQNVEIQLIWNNETDKFKDLQDRIIWSGNEPGVSGTALWVNEDGSLVITKIMITHPALLADPNILIDESNQGVWIGFAFIEFYKDDEYAGGDELNFIKGFTQAKNKSRLIKNTPIFAVNNN